MYLADLEAAHATFGFKLAQLYGQGESPMTITGLDKRRMPTPSIHATSRGYALPEPLRQW